MNIKWDGERTLNFERTSPQCEAFRFNVSVEGRTGSVFVPKSFEGRCAPKPCSGTSCPPVRSLAERILAGDEYEVKTNQSMAAVDPIHAAMVIAGQYSAARQEWTNWSAAHPQGPKRFIYGCKGDGTVVGRTNMCDSPADKRLQIWGSDPAFGFDDNGNLYYPAGSQNVVGSIEIKR